MRGRRRWSEAPALGDRGGLGLRLLCLQVSRLGAATDEREHFALALTLVAATTDSRTAATITTTRTAGTIGHHRPERQRRATSAERAR
jgi:hypothetical protein